MILHGTVYSKSLGMDTGLTVVGPTELQAGKEHPVIYLLHGLHGNSEAWVNNSLLPVYARKYQALFIMPEAARSFYTDQKYGLRYYRYVAEELPRICKGLFNISSKREHTAIMGGSMGGYGALKCALTKPEQYGACAAFSAACLFFQEHLNVLRTPCGAAEFKAAFGEQLITDFKAIFGEELQCAETDEIEHLARKCPTPQQPRVYMACGYEDYLRDYNTRFSSIMQSLNYDFTFEEWAGKHDWYFFNEALRRAIIWLLGEPQKNDGRSGSF